MKNIYLIVLILIAPFLSANIIHVKQDGTGHFTSIQAAYMAAATGDTILVYPGIYYENLDIYLPGISVTIASLDLLYSDTGHIGVTIIDGSQNGSVVKINNTAGSEIIIHGFTIRNGSGHGNFKRGGGIFINSGNPSIINCIIENNNAISGGGVHVNQSAIFISGTTIRHNIATLGGGGLIIGSGCNIIFDTVNKCNIYMNHAMRGTDIHKSYLSPGHTIILDTATVINPDHYFIVSTDNFGFPVNDLIINIENAVIDPVQANLYVDPAGGSNNNTGLTPDDPLKTLSFAFKKIQPDSSEVYSIYLANGTYAFSENGEQFPVQLRSNINLIGESRENTILDAENITKLLRGNNLTANYILRNLTFKRGYNVHLLYFGPQSGLSLNYNDKVVIENLLITECVGPAGKLDVLHSSDVCARNVEVTSNTGGAVMLGYTAPANPSSFRVENLLIDDTSPYFIDDIDGSGGGLGIAGRLSIPFNYRGSVSNLQISRCLSIPDPIWGPRLSIAMSITNHAIVDIVNATIGHNILQGEEGYAVGLSEGSVMNLYNSILYYDSLYEIVLGDRSLYSYPVAANICYSNIEGGEEKIYNWFNKHTLNWLDGNIDTDPMWLGDGEYPYQLLKGSPCINAGTPMYVDGMAPPYIKMEEGIIVLYKINGDTLHLPSVDLAGNPRISGGRIDMGAYEYQDPTFIGKPTAAEGEDVNIHIYPNPFWVHTFVTFRLKKAGNVLVFVNDLNGNLVKTLMDSRLPNGEYNMIWKGNDNNGNPIPKGTYIINMYLNNHPVYSGKIIKL